MTTRLARTGLGTLVLSVAAGLAAAPPVPVVVVVDTSRSLRAAELKTALAGLAGTLATLSPDTPCGLVEFNDAARWVVPVGSPPARVAGALAGLATAGRYSVLHDALVIAGRALPSGGVIVVATDGCDENSLSTVADFTALLRANHVSVVALGLGRRLDERTLRRFTLLSGGEYVGEARTTTRDGVAQAIARGQRAVQSLAGAVTPERVAQPAPAAVVPAGQEATAPLRAASPPAAARETSWGGMFLVAVAVLAGAALVIWLVRRRPRGRVCEDCGRPLEAWETFCSHCRIEHLELDKAAAKTPVAGPARALEEHRGDDADLDPGLFEKAPSQLQLDKTFSLQAQPVLVVRQPEAPARTFVIESGRTVTVGRDASVNTIAVEERTVSAQHFKIVPQGEDLFVLDLGSTNGTLVNGARVRVHRLQHGDVISSGEVEFELRQQYSRPTSVPASA
jgi:hypothetical protein